MKSRNLPILFLLFFCVASCSKEDVNPIESISEFTRLEIGNYWVYEWYEIKPDGSESNFQVRDSLYIKGDTIIGGNRFFIRSGTFFENERTEILFDSAKSLFTYPERDMLFTLDPTQKITKQFPEDNTLMNGSYALLANEVMVTVPAGNFECLNFEGILESLETDYPHGTRINSNLYSKGVGLVVLRTQFYSSPNDLAMRLTKYGSVN